MQNKKYTMLAIFPLLLCTSSSFAERNVTHDLTGSADVSRVWVNATSKRAERALEALNQAGAEIHYRFDDLDAFAASVPTAALPGLSRNPNITSIEEDPKRYPSAQSVPYGIDAVQARYVWDSDGDGVLDTDSPNGSGITICIIDSGLHTAHADMAGVDVKGGYPPSGWNHDTCGHGTHVAGTIIAAHNTEGVVGVSPGKASLYIVKVFDGPSCGWAYSSDLVDAANRCDENGANIISMSLGGGIRSRNEDQAFKKLYNNKGILSVAAAGNDGNTRKSYPASYNSVVSVAAVDSSKVVADFSQQNASVELAAPGVGVLSTVPWLATNTLTVDGMTYSGGHIEFSALGSVSGTLVDGGLCDSAGSWTGKVVMCQRGDISFNDKIVNVVNGRGSAAVIYNNVAGGFAGTLGDGNSSVIPAISLSMEDGQAVIGSSSAVGSPGNVVSTLSQPDSGYEAWNGTSMATPHVSGVAAVVWSAIPTASNSEIRDALTATAVDLGDTGRDSAYGYGLVQAYDAWQYLGGGGGGNNQAPVASFTSNCTDLSCTFDGTGSSDTDGSIANYSWTFGDGNSNSGGTASHNYAAGGTYTVSLTVTDDAGGSNTQNKNITVSTGGGSGTDTTPPVISNVTAAKTKGQSFAISWTTDEQADSTVTFVCCGDFKNSNLVSSHSMSFRGSKGVEYKYSVTSKDASGNSATSGPHLYQN